MTWSSVQLMMMIKLNINATACGDVISCHDGSWLRVCAHAFEIWMLARAAGAEGVGWGWGGYLCSKVGRDE